MGNVVHETVPVRIWADVDIGIAGMVRYLNTIPGVRTHASCQGTLGEGGPAPYRAQVMVTWDTAETFARLAAEFDTSEVSESGHWCQLHPREGWQPPSLPEQGGPITPNLVEAAKAMLKAVDGMYIEFVDREQEVRQAEDRLTAAVRQEENRRADPPPLRAARLWPEKTHEQ